MSSQQPPPPQKDWSATQYLKFHDERTRAVRDLVSFAAPLVHASSPSSPVIYDLGCGPGNSTSVLLSAFPSAHITGIDSSPDMLSRASATHPDIPFERADLATYSPAADADLLFSNAVLHWLRSPQRIPTATRLFAGMKKGGVLALQVPDNYAQPSHALMRSTALQPNEPWTPFFADTRIGDTSDSSRPDLDPIESPGDWYDALVAAGAREVHVWRTEYMHVLKDAGAIVEWVKGTGLQPFLHAIADEGARGKFLEAYEEALRGAYEVRGDGKVVLGYPRLFVVAVRG
ncbi:trans-aconitate 2-methyltransferase [Pyrenochaeta sp. DS3sAY3a]|nr:trans-aconitate 2-methyltransferase [Pyrenochaeta sp. DS3sAY3a]